MFVKIEKKTSCMGLYERKLIEYIRSSNYLWIHLLRSKFSTWWETVSFSHISSNWHLIGMNSINTITLTTNSRLSVGRVAIESYPCYLFIFQMKVLGNRPLTTTDSARFRSILSTYGNLKLHIKTWLKSAIYSKFSTVCEIAVGSPLESTRPKESLVFFYPTMIFEPKAIFHAFAPSVLSHWFPLKQEGEAFGEGKTTFWLESFNLSVGGVAFCSWVTSV